MALWDLTLNTDGIYVFRYPYRVACALLIRAAPLKLCCIAFFAERTEIGLDLSKAHIIQAVSLLVVVVVLLLIFGNHLQVCYYLALGRALNACFTDQQYFVSRILTERRKKKQQQQC